MKIHTLASGRIYEGDWMEAPLEGDYDMAEVDGPYAMGIADWDTMGLAGLAAWYRPHFERLTSLMAKSASVYLWNTAEGWALLNPEMQRLGWTFRALIVWDKGVASLAGKGVEGMRTWPSVTEFCGFYQRGPNEMDLWNEWGASHPVRAWMDGERQKAGLSIKDVDRMIGVSDMARHWFTWSQWCLPSEERYRQLRDIIPSLDRPLSELKEAHAKLWAEYRNRLELLRPTFTLPMGTSNVWNHPVVAGPERLKDANGNALHPCQKPLIFAERMVQASTRPGMRVLIPFGGTCRIATYLERLKRNEPENARYYDCCELNADGKDYLGAVLGRMGEDAAAKAGQLSLFGGKR